MVWQYIKTNFGDQLQGHCISHNLGLKRRGRSKRTWMDVIKIDMKLCKYECRLGS